MQDLNKAWHSTKVVRTREKASCGVFLDLERVIIDHSKFARCHFSLGFTPCSGPL